MITATSLRTQRLGLGISRVNSQDSRIEGKIHVYDGAGKGKSQAALGIVLRSIGLGIANPLVGSKVMLLRLLKGADRDFDEDGSIAVLQFAYPHLIDHVRTGRNLNRDLGESSLVIEDYIEANRGWHIAKGAIVSGLYSVVVIDELNPALSLGLIDIDDVIETLLSRPPHVEVISTGRNCPPQLLEIADLHSEIVSQQYSKKNFGLDIYTGNGKGKSTSALGRAIQGIGRSILNEDESGKVLILQFLKGSSGYTEEPAITALREAYPKLVEHYRCGTAEIVWWNNRKEIDYSEAQAGWAIAKAAIASGEYQMIVLDELNCVVNLELLPNLLDVHDVLANKPRGLQIIATGRFSVPHDKDATPSYYQLADRILNVTEHRHYCNQNHTPRYGVDY